MTTPVVLITGALTGIGRATALAFAQEGARIVVSGRRDPLLETHDMRAGAKAVAEHGARNFKGKFGFQGK